MLPSQKEEVFTATTTVHNPLLIAEKVPEKLMVHDFTGPLRSVLSYKTAINVQAVAFLAPDCAANAAQLPALRRFYERYKEWKVSFLAIGRGSDPAPVRQMMDKSGLAFDLAMDPDGTVHRFLNITQTPYLVVFDESGVLRYRGPVAEFAAKGTGRAWAREAMDHIIGHVEAVTIPEPQATGGCPVP